MRHPGPTQWDHAEGAPATVAAILSPAPPVTLQIKCEGCSKHRDMFLGLFLALVNPTPKLLPVTTHRWTWGIVKPVMGRAVILATAITSILASLSPCRAASDTEIVSLSDKMSGAFRCSTYASLFHDQKEQQRLFQIGLKAGRDYVEGLKSRDDPASEMLTFMRGVSTDFVVGQMYEAESTHAYDEIVKYQNGLPLNQLLDAAAAKTQAELSYRKSNCSLIQ